MFNHENVERFRQINFNGKISKLIHWGRLVNELLHFRFASALNESKSVSKFLKLRRFHFSVGKNALPLFIKVGEFQLPKMLIDPIMRE